MTYIRRAILYLLPLVRVLAIGLTVCILLLGILRGGVWIMARHDVADGVTGPEIFVWHMADENFGGLSALIMAPDGTTLLTASDRGTFVEAQVQRDSAERITALTAPKLTQVSLASGLPPTNFKMDIEALSLMPDGRIAAAFEGFVRIEMLATPQARPTSTHRWDRFVARFGNQAFEALATLPDGRLLAIAEVSVAPGQAATVIYDGKTWRRGPPLPVGRGFAITGADVGPDGCLYLVERRFGVATGFTFRVRRLAGREGAWEDTPLYTSPAATLGNAEGISAWAAPDGRVVLSVVTDNGFLPLHKTRLMEFRLPPGECALDL